MRAAPVSLIGHDAGLMVAYAYAQAFREEVSHLIVMPSSTASRRFSKHPDKQCQRERRKPICDDRGAALRRREISFSQGAKWNALISTYIGTIPLSGEASCPAEHIMSAPPLVT
jgi:pimeloyl-ACP methyl ester carboxylesterase